MTTIHTEVTIDAAPDKVWGILTDFPAMADWNPFIRSITGSLAPGAQLSVEIAPPGRSAMTFKPTVLVAALGRELRWRGTVMAQWVFSGEHYFLLEEAGPRATRLTHGETFSGVLAPLVMRGAALQATKQGFAAMNDALKRRAEG